MRRIKFSDYLAIILFIAGVVITSFQVETKQLILRILEKWQIIVFGVCITGLGCKIMQLWMRYYVDKQMTALKQIMRTNVIILKAVYGEATETDVTKKVQELVDAGYYPLKVDLRTLACEDKEVGSVKRLKIYYKIGTNELIISAKEGEQIRLF
jgi:hypothetical protein